MDSYKEVLKQKPMIMALQYFFCLFLWMACVCVCVCVKASTRDDQESKQSPTHVANLHNLPSLLTKVTKGSHINKPSGHFSVLFLALTMAQITSHHFLFLQDVFP
jgi:hypothetical protein